MNKKWLGCLLTLILLHPAKLWADHPQEGKVAIQQLLSEAEQNNLELKEAEARLRMLKASANSTYGAFAPKLSIEGGPQNSRLDSERTSGTTIFAKAEWNLINGGEDSAKTESALMEVQIQEKKMAWLRAKIKRQVSKVYFELQYLLESLSLKQKAIQMNTQQKALAKQKNRSGLTTSSDILEFDLRESTLQSDLVLLNQNLSQKTRELDLLLSRPSASPNLAVKGHLLRESTPLDRQKILDQILQNNQELWLAKQDQKFFDLDRQMVKSRFYPKVDFEAKYGRLGSEEQVYSDSNNYFVALKFKIPLFDGLADYNSLGSSSAKLTQANVLVAQKSLSLAVELDTSLAEISALNARLDLEEKNLERSERYYSLTLEEYKRGIKNSPDMVGAAERLIEANIRNLEYRRDLCLARLKIDELVGD